MKIKRIELGQILIVCLIILGFSLTLITFFQNDKEFSHYRNIIFWLIILPFGFEAIIASIANITVKFRKTTDIFLILCFISLFIALLFLFSFGAFPKFDFISKYSNVIGIISITLVMILYFVLQFVGAKHTANIKSGIHKCHYRLTKKLKEKEYIDYIVTVSKDVYLMYIMNSVSKSFGGYGVRIYSLKEFLKGEFELVDENIELVTDVDDDLLEIIKKMESLKNNVLGIILTYTPNDKLKKSLLLFNVQYCD